MRMMMLVAVLVAGCGSESDPGPTGYMGSISCQPGSVAECAGPGGCVGDKTCLVSGSAYGACVCLNAKPAAVSGMTYCGTGACQPCGAAGQLSCQTTEVHHWCEYGLELAECSPGAFNWLTKCQDPACGSAGKPCCVRYESGCTETKFCATGLTCGAGNTCN